MSGTLISRDEYLSTAYEPDCEYVDGELIERNTGEADHSALQAVMAALLFNRRREMGIHVFPAVRVQTSATRFRVPDITVTTQKVRGRILREPPFLCIEILSPEDRASRMQLKVADYLAFGVKYVWVIDPRTKTAWNYSSDHKAEPTRVLTTAEPSLTLSLDELFTSIEEDIDV